MTLNFNVDPYYDDFDETKGFHKILFKPGTAVQARELTQIQTLLQKQISRFGDSVYKEGSVVTGGEHFLDDSIYYIKVNTPGVDTSNIEGKYIKEVTDTNSIRWALVKKYTPATSTDPATLHVSIVSGKIAPFSANTELQVFAEKNGEVALYTLTSVSSNASGYGLLFHVNQGVFYSRGAFVFCPAQTAVVGKYSKLGSGVVGLSIVETIISADVDDSLLDPAFGSYNYAAPGADRYMIALELTVKPYTEITQAHEDFIELIHVRDGVLLSDKRLPIYSNIGDTLARRTYDESGDYIVTPFIPKITQDQNDQIIGSIGSIQSDTEATMSADSIIAFTGLRLKRERGGIGYNLSGTISVSNDNPNKLIGVGTSFSSELSTSDVIKTGADSNLILELSPGKAYVGGYEIERNGPTNIRLNKARSTKIDTEQEMNVYYGNYTLVSSISGSLPNINAGVLVDLHNNTIPSSSTIIGKAQVINLDYASGTGAESVYAIVFESLTLSGNTFDGVKSVAISSDNYATTTFKAVIDTSAIVSNKTKLYDSNYTSLVFNVPPGSIKSIDSVEYHYRKKYSGITVTGGVATISTDSSIDRFAPSVSSTQYRENFAVVVKTKSTGTFTTGEFIALDDGLRTVTVTAISGTPGQATIDLNDNTFNGTIDIIATIRTSDASRVTKTLVANHVKEISLNTSAKSSIGVSDIFKLNKVYELQTLDVFKGEWSATTSYIANDIAYIGAKLYRASDSSAGKSPETESSYWEALSDSSTYYTLDNGQRDSHYDHGSITRVSTDVATRAVVVFDYFTHTGYGYISADSYTIDYSSIPSYTDSKGVIYNLRSTLDFRPRRVDNSTTMEYQTFYIPKLSESVVCSIEYYLQKVDRIVMTREGNIKVLEGVPSVTRPVAPISQDDSMSLFVITYGAYTDTEKDVSIHVVPNRRYTMRDIGAIDNRIKNIEYYTALNLVESNVNNQTFMDANGLPLFKNGYLVDSFKGSDVGDVTNHEYNCAIDSEEGELRAPFDMRSIVFNRDETATIQNSIKSSDGIMTVDYTEQPFINQNVASSAISVNPFDVVAFSGTLKISPDSDIWVDIDSAPDIVQNEGGLNDNFASYQSLGTVWNSWETIFGGTETQTGTTTKIENGFSITRATFDIFENKRGTGVETLQAPAGQVISTSTKTLNKTAIPYARAKDLAFEVHGMTPNVELYLYIDGKHMSNYIVDTSTAGIIQGSANGIIPREPLKTDESGYAFGTIHFPSNANTKFLSGKHTLSLCDNAIDPTLATCWAEVVYTSEGIIQTDQKTIVSTRGGYKVTRNVTKTELFKVRTEERILSKVPVYTGPNANYDLKVDKTTIREGGKVTFTLTANNAPINRTYFGTLSGSSGLQNSDITGASLGSVTLKSKGTLASNTATLPVTVVLDVIDETDEELTLTVNIPADPNHPEWGGPVALTASTTITNATPAAYTTSAPSKVNEGDTISVVLSGSGLNNTVSASYVVTGTCTEYTGSSSGTVTLQSSNNYSQTLSFPVSANAVTGDPETFIITFTLPNGQSHSKTVMVHDVVGTPPGPVDQPTYSLTGPSEILEGEWAEFNVTATNVPAGTIVFGSGVWVSDAGSTEPPTEWQTWDITKKEWSSESRKSSWWASIEPSTGIGKFRWKATSNVNQKNSGTIKVSITTATYDPLGTSSTVVIQTSPSVVVQSKDIDVPPPKIGDFVDSKMTIAEAITAYRYDGIAVRYYGASAQQYSGVYNRQPTRTWFDWFRKYGVATKGKNSATYEIDIYFPVSGEYKFDFSVDNEGSVSVDGVNVINKSGNDDSHYRNKHTNTLNVTMGIHKVSLIAKNIGAEHDVTNPWGVALQIFKPDSTELWNTLHLIDILPSGKFMTRDRTDSELSQFGSAVKAAYVDNCNRNPDVAGWVKWMDYLCAQVTTKASTFTSQAVNSGGYANDSRYFGFRDPKYLVHSQKRHLSGKDSIDTQTSYRTVTLQPGTYNIFAECGRNPLNIQFLTEFQGTDVFPPVTVDSYKSVNTSINVTQQTTFLLKVTATYKYIPDCGFGFRFFITNININEEDPDDGTSVTVWDHKDHLASEVITGGSTPTPMTVTEAIAALTQPFIDAAAHLDDLKANRPTFLACTTDPLAESFFVDKAIYPNGMFVSGVDIYFKTKDTTIPVWAEIRPNVNGYPSSDTKVPGTTVFLKPQHVKISSNASVATTFKFDFPAFLKPGEYSIVVGSNSSKYYAYISEMGQKQLGTNNIISKQPYVGSLFKSQNASTWTAAQEQDLMFKLYRCEFDTSKTYEMVLSNAYDEEFEFDTIKINSTEIDFGEKTDIVYQIANTNNIINSTIDSFSNITANKNTNLTHRKKIDSDGDTKLKISMKTNDKNISPVVDSQKLSCFIIENIISKSSELTVPEETPYGGNAYAKYVSRNLTLAEGFDATGLRIILDVNRPQGTSVKVYAKVLAADDGDQFDYKPYQEIQIVNKPQVFSKNENDFIIDEYIGDNISYYSTAGKHTSFRTFAIKIVMFSDDPVKVPRIKNLRAIATS